MDIRYIHFYQGEPTPNLDPTLVAANAEKIFPNCQIDVRNSFYNYWGIDHYNQICDQARISDAKQPFEKQPEVESYEVGLYDGYALQELLRSMISDGERGSEHVHIIMTDMLMCTFDEDDWRYHARAVICGTPSIVSCPGIIEAPAKPREYYMLARPGQDPHLLQNEFAGRFIEYGDSRLASAALAYSVQAVFFFLADGEPFCENPSCRLYNAHWQEELIRILENPIFCEKHAAILDQSNKLRKGN